MFVRQRYGNALSYPLLTRKSYVMEMTEEWIYFFWNTRNFKHTNLNTIDGRLIEILKYGIRNRASGPDFIHAAIRLDALNWHGNIEMHVLTGDWQKHGHQNDDAYDNVILHVVWKHDWDPTEGRVPILELCDLVDDHLLSRCAKITTTPAWLPCESLLNEGAFSRLALWKDSLVTARLGRRWDEFEKSTANSNLDWDGRMYQLLCMYLMGRENKGCGEQLAMRLPLAIIERNRHQPLAVLSMVLGVSDCLEDVPDLDFRNYLQVEFRFCEQKYGLSPMKRAAWRRFGMRAAGMPVRRLAQLAALLSARSRFQSEVTQSNSAAELYQLLNLGLPDDERWQNLLPASTLFTNDTREMIVLNVFLPLWFCYANAQNPTNKDQLIFDIFQELPAEKNQICSQFTKRGFEVRSALDSQALLELRSQYCVLKRCASCSIGQYIFTNTKEIF